MRPRSARVAQVHSWVVACLPEVPARLQDDEGSFAFRNTFLGTLLLAKYAKGEATFKSESLTTLAIVKEVRAKRLELRARGSYSRPHDPSTTTRPRQQPIRRAQVLTKEATGRKIQIHISVDIKDVTVGNMLRKIDPLLQYQLSLNKKAPPPLWR